MALLQITDKENAELFKNIFNALVAGKEVKHLGKVYKPSVIGGKRTFRVKTFLAADALVAEPTKNGACNITIRVSNMVTQNEEKELHPQIRGQVKSGRSGEPVCYFFLEEPAAQARAGLAAKLVQAGKVTVEDLSGILNDYELSLVQNR